MSPKAANRWVKFDLKSIPSETPVRVRTGKDAPVVVVLSQHNQLLTGDDRHLVEWVPEEMNLAVSDEPAPEA